MARKIPCRFYYKGVYLKDFTQSRGYTSHEHFEDIGIIHMNGRLYDPLLRSFLNADENIQDSNNTQNYNKYGYVMNNPLLYNDPSGEFFIVDDIIISAIIIGAIIGAGTYIIQAAITGNWDWGGFIKSIFFGAISGAVTAGIGNIFTTTVQGVQVATKFAETALGVISQAAAHGVAQGALSLMQGGKFEQALISGMLGSLGAKLWISEAGKFASSTFGMVTFGAIAGGIGSELTGGNFWQGVVIGGMVAGLNDALHKIDGPGDGNKGKKNKGKITLSSSKSKYSRLAQGNSTLNPKDEFKYRGAMTLNTVGGILSDVGDGLVITGYGVSLTGVGAPLGAGLSTVGGSVALVGNGLQFTYAYMHDDYYAMGKIIRSTGFKHRRC